jgi:hypothetical protein
LTRTNVALLATVKRPRSAVSLVRACIFYLGVYLMATSIKGKVVMLMIVNTDNNCRDIGQQGRRYL